MSDFGKWEDRNSWNDDGPAIVRLRPNSDEATTRFKINRAIELLRSNDEVQIVVKLRGREKARPEDAEAMLQSILLHIVPKHARIVSNPKSNGSQVVCVIGANKETGIDEATNAN